MWLWGRKGHLDLCVQHRQKNKGGVLIVSQKGGGGGGGGAATHNAGFTAVRVE